MKELVLLKGQLAFIDDEDYDKCISAVGPGASWRLAGGYIKGQCRINGNICNLLLHRFILGDPSGVVDHADHNPLNNQRANLRICSYSQNNANRIDTNNGSSVFKNVRQRYYSNRDGNYSARIKVNKKAQHLGTFKTAQEAAFAYDMHAFYFFGEFAYLNFGENVELYRSECVLGLGGFVSNKYKQAFPLISLLEP